MGVVVIVGEDRFLASEAVREAAGDRESGRMAGGEVSLGAVLDEVRTPDFFGGGRCVVLEDAEALLDDPGLDALADYAEAPAPGSLLVVRARKIDGRKSGAKRLKKAARWVAVQAPPEWKIKEWVAARARDAHGLQAGRDAVEALVGRIGPDLGALDGALRRLKEQISPETRIRAADVEGSTEEHRSPALFEAGNAVESGDLPRALEAVDAAFREGLRMRADSVTEDAGVALILLGQLHGTYRKLIRFHMLRRGSSDEEAARGAGVSPKAARYFVDRARRHRLERLLERHEAFVTADRDLKRSAAEPRQVLERLLVGLLG